MWKREREVMIVAPEMRAMMGVGLSTDKAFEMRVE